MSMLLTTKKLAERKHVAAGTVRQWVAKSWIRPALVRPGGSRLFDAESVDRQLARRHWGEGQVLRLTRETTEGPSFRLSSAFTAGRVTPPVDDLVPSAYSDWIRCERGWDAD